MSFADLVEQMDVTALEVFGEPVPIIYAPKVGAAVPLTGIFDEQFVLAKGSGEAGADATAPAVFFRRSQLPVDPDEDDPTLTITLNGAPVLFVVSDRQTAGQGGIVLILRRKR